MTMADKPNPEITHQEAALTGLMDQIAEIDRRIAPLLEERRLLREALFECWHNNPAGWRVPGDLARRLRIALGVANPRKNPRTSF
jgi:hypothetical protein